MSPAGGTANRSQCSFVLLHASTPRRPLHVLEKRVYRYSTTISLPSWLPAAASAAAAIRMKPAVFFTASNQGGPRNSPPGAAIPAGAATSAMLFHLILLLSPAALASGG